MAFGSVSYSLFVLIIFFLFFILLRILISDFC